MKEAAAPRATRRDLQILEYSLLMSSLAILSNTVGGGSRIPQRYFLAAPEAQERRAGQGSIGPGAGSLLRGLFCANSPLSIHSARARRNVSRQVHALKRERMPYSRANGWCARRRSLARRRFIRWRTAFDVIEFDSAISSPVLPSSFS